MHLKLATIGLLVGLLTGCSNSVIYRYSASSSLSLQGEIQIGSFRYLPSEQDPNIKPNQLQTSFETLLNTPIHSYFESALFNELKWVGVNIKESDQVLNGDIKEFSRKVDFPNAIYTLEVEYVVSNKSGLGCYRNTLKVQKVHDAFDENWQNIFNEVIKLNMEKIFKDPQFVSCIHP